MKKRIITILLSTALITTLLTGCGTPYSEAKEALDQSFGNGYFTIIKEWRGMCEYKIVYANDTRVMYLICSANSLLDITPLFNPDGTLQVYEEGE